MLHVNGNIRGNAYFLGNRKFIHSAQSFNAFVGEFSAGGTFLFGADNNTLVGSNVMSVLNNKTAANNTMANNNKIAITPDWLESNL